MGHPSHGGPSFAGIAHLSFEDADRQLAAELKAARIQVVRMPEIMRRRDSIIRGSAGPWTFERAWYYWIARGAAGLPPDIADRLHEEHGESVRVDGHCGCPSPREWLKGFGPILYHVDTPEGLAALATAIRGVLERNEATVEVEDGCLLIVESGTRELAISGDCILHEHEGGFSAPTIEIDREPLDRVMYRARWGHVPKGDRGGSVDPTRAELGRVRIVIVFEALGEDGGYR